MKNQGFTLTEVLIATFLFSILAGVLYSILALSSISARTHEVTARINFDGMQVLRIVNREIGQTSYTSDRLVMTTDGNGNSVVRFQIPVDYDDDGDVVTSSLTKSTEWGAYDTVGATKRGSGANPLNRWVRYSVSNGQLIREVLDGTLVADSSLTSVINNDVQSFTITQNSSTINLTMVISIIDQVGQSGTARTIQRTFTHQTFLRNVPT